MLLISVVGAIGLCWLALLDHDPYRLIALAIYCVVVVVPVVVLSSRA